MSNTGPEGPVPGAASGGGGAGPSSTSGSPAGAVSGEGRERSFEALQKELEDVVARLERGDVAVDDAIALFRRGEELYRACVERLQAAELRIEEMAPSDPPRP
jgi:exodeoxyribonuclease VII small subunit